MQTTLARSRPAAFCSRGRAPQRRPAVVVQAAAQPSPLRQAASQLLAAGLAAGLVLTPAQPANAAFEQLADIVREQYSFVDADNDGVITKAELIRTTQEYAEEVDFKLPTDDTMEFSLRLFDLNQDGKLTTDELLTSIVLDGAVDMEERAVDEDVFKVFDKNNDGFVDFQEFSSATPDIGPNGAAVKDYLFKRVDRLVDSNNKLSGDEFVNTLQLFRTTVLGY